MEQTLTKSHICTSSHSRLRFPMASRTWMARFSLPAPRRTFFVPGTVAGSGGRSHRTHVAGRLPPAVPITVTAAPRLPEVDPAGARPAPRWPCPVCSFPTWVRATTGRTEYRVSRSSATLSAAIGGTCGSGPWTRTPGSGGRAPPARCPPPGVGGPAGPPVPRRRRPCGGAEADRAGDAVALRSYPVAHLAAGRSHPSRWMVPRHRRLPQPAVTVIPHGAGFTGAAGHPGSGTGRAAAGPGQPRASRRFPRPHRPRASGWRPASPDRRAAASHPGVRESKCTGLYRMSDRYTDGILYIGAELCKAGFPAPRSTFRCQRSDPCNAAACRPWTAPCRPSGPWRAFFSRCAAPRIHPVSGEGASCTFCDRRPCGRA